MLKPLAAVKLPDLIKFDRQSNVDELMQAMRLDPDWSTLLDGPAFQNASQMVMQLFSFLFEKNASYFNRLVREGLLSQAESERAIYACLDRLGVPPRQNTAASVEVFGTVQGSPLTEPLLIQRFTKVSAKDANNAQVGFELILKREDGRYNYRENIIVQPTWQETDVFKLMAYAGTTWRRDFAVTDSTLENFRVKLSDADTIEDSVMAYYQSPTGVMTELIESSSFVVAPVPSPQFPNGTPHFVVGYDDLGKAILYFGDADFGGGFDETHVGGVLVVYGRSGGGAVSNVVAGSINQTLQIQLSSTKSVPSTIPTPGTPEWDVWTAGLDDETKELLARGIGNELSTAAQFATVTFSNIVGAGGGSDRESAFEAQVFGPLRYGRGRPHILDDDVRAALADMTVKHEVNTPEFNEVTPSAPLLHAVHAIAPKRNTASLALPQPLTADTASTYLGQLMVALNAFYGVVGTRWSAVIGELASSFVYDNNDGVYNFTHKLNHGNPLSGTLMASAWSVENKLVDKIYWNGNYPVLELIKSATSTDHAAVTTAVKTTFMINESGVDRNNKVRLMFDESTYVFDLALPAGMKTIEQLADAMQYLISAAIATDPAAYAYFGGYGAWAYAEYIPEIGGSGGSIRFRSPGAGLISKITILESGLPATADPAADLYHALALVPGIYRPAEGTELVFSPGNLYYHVVRGQWGPAEIQFLINSAPMSAIRSFARAVAWEQNQGVQDGPELLLQLLEEDGSSRTVAQLYKTITVDALDSGGVVLDSLNFPSLQDVDTNTASTPTTGTVFKDTLDNKFAYSTSTAALMLLDGVEVTQYARSYPAVYEIRAQGVVWNSGTGQWDDDANAPVVFIEPMGTDSRGNAWPAWTQDRYELAGPTVALAFATALTVGYNYRVSLYKLVGGVYTRLAWIYFLNISASATTPGTLYQTDAGAIAPYAAVLDTTTIIRAYGPSTKILKLRLNDGAVDISQPPYYDPGYDDALASIRFTLKRKSYSYITIDYRPNMYEPYGEAATYVSILSDKVKRLLCLEHVVRDITFFPIGIDVTVTVAKAFSLVGAREAVTALLKSGFKYDNSNFDHTIGIRITEDSIRALISKISNQFGIRRVTVTERTMSASVSDADAANTYFFILDDLTISRLVDAEKGFPQIVGIADMLRLNVAIAREA